MIVAATLACYRCKVQKQRVNRVKRLRELRQARYRWFFKKKRLLTLLE